MFLKRVRSEGLAHISYYLESNEEAAVIDPRRDVDDYLTLARERGARVVLVLETHRNEDYVSGALELANATGAAIYHGDQLEFGYGNPLEDGQEFRLGDLIIRAMHTPGHTYESHCYLVSDDRGPFLLFSGDTLFSGDVGRTDLTGPESTRDLSEMLYRSLHERIVPLGPEIMVLPAHGAGSACGHDISEREMTTIGLEVRDNHALSMSKLDFMMAKMGEGMERPPYFSRMEALNLNGPIIFGTLPQPPPLPPKKVMEAQEGGALVLDVREPHNFAAAHVPGALNVWLNGLPIYGGYAIPYGRPLIIVAERQQQVDLAVRYLIRIGYEDIIGHLGHGMESWIKGGNATSTIAASTVHEIRRRQLAGEDMLLVDLRDRRELGSGAIPGAMLLHLGRLMERSSELPRDREMVLFCGSGYRGGIAASLLRNSGITNVRIMLGGLGSWKANGYPVEKLRSV
ncbi:MAG TPA: MBL fold metallo-hydrolase [Methanomassiliicoccales archaeon]|nr:MBL fold metallo-hydrolase [Methanomassiliicoccales archaeon]